MICGNKSVKWKQGNDIMYSNWEDLEKACQCFLWVMADGDLSPTMRIFIAEQSQNRFREIENI